MKARVLVIVLGLMALTLGAVVVAQDGTADGVWEGFTGEILTFTDPNPQDIENMAVSDGTLEAITADSASWYGQVVALEGTIEDFVNARIFALGEGAALDNDQVLVVNNAVQDLPPEIMKNARIRVIGRVHPSMVAVQEGAPNNFDPLFAGQAQDSAVTQPQEGETSTTGPAESMVVTVTESDGVIDMPTSISAGLITFEVTNNGTMEHNFEIEGNGVESVFDTNLQPGETRTMEVELGPGTYEVYCPVEDHAEQGMRLQLEVTGEAVGETAPEGEAGVISPDFSGLNAALSEFGIAVGEDNVANFQELDRNLENLSEEQWLRLADALEQNAASFETDQPTLAQAFRDAAAALRNNDIATARTTLQNATIEIQNQQMSQQPADTTQEQAQPEVPAQDQTQAMTFDISRPDMVDWVQSGLVPEGFENFTILEVLSVENVSFVELPALMNGG